MGLSPTERDVIDTSEQPLGGVFSFRWSLAGTGELRLPLPRLLVDPLLQVRHPELPSAADAQARYTALSRPVAQSHDVNAEQIGSRSGAEELKQLVFHGFVLLRKPLSVKLTPAPSPWYPAGTEALQA